MKHTKILTLITLATVSTSQAAFTLLEDFSSSTAGAAYANVDDYPGSEAPTVELDNLNVFGLGTANKYALIDDSGGTGGGGIQTPGNSMDFSDGFLGSYSFDFVDISNNMAMRLGAGSPWGDDDRWSVSITSVPDDSAVKLTFLLNRSGSSQNFFNPVTSMNESLDDENIAVFYHDGTDYFAITTGTGPIANSELNPTYLYFNQAASGGGVRVDNISTSSLLEVDSIPEPSSALLGALGALALLRRRR